MGAGLMLALILTVCTLAQPEQCAETRLIYADVSPIQCALHGQEQAAAWAEDHPTLRVARWRCGRDGSPA